MFDKFEWIVSRYEELSEAIVQPEIIQDTAKYQACLKERAALEPQVEAWQEQEDGSLKPLQVNSDGSMYKDPDTGEWVKISK